MNPELKKQWVKALRSGEYKQGIGRLRSVADQFCCLGVLADLLPGKWVPSTNLNCHLKDTGSGNTQGTISDNHLDLDIQDYLINLNDEEDKSFEEIADYIERTL